MTTDTFPKLATRTVAFGDATVTINGIAKGAGMIAPDMATMLSFVMTDAPIAAPVLQALLSKGVGRQLQRDHRRQRHLDLRHAAALRHRQAAKARAAVTSLRDRRLGAFRAALDDLLLDLAHQVVRDGEGARKFVEVRVDGRGVEALGASGSRCRSPTRRWSRPRSPARTPTGAAIVMAVGKAGEPADRDRLAISFGDIRVAVKGERDPAYSEAATSAYMKDEAIVITVDIGLGKGSDASGPATSPRNTSRSTATTGAGSARLSRSRPAEAVASTPVRLRVIKLDAVEPT